MAKEKAGVLNCSFCGKSQKEIKKLIAGPNDVYICNLCVAICIEIINDDAQKDAAAAPTTEEGSGRKNVKKKVPKKEAATTEKKQPRQPGRTKNVHSMSSLIPKRSAIR